MDLEEYLDSKYSPVRVTSDYKWGKFVVQPLWAKREKLLEEMREVYHDFEDKPYESPRGLLGGITLKDLVNQRVTNNFRRR